MKLNLRGFFSGKIVPRVIVGIATCVFLASVCYPFLTGVLWPPYGFTGSRGVMTGKLWSFKGTFVMRVWVGWWGDLNFSVSTPERWFTDYWVFGRIPNQSYA